MLELKSQYNTASTTHVPMQTTLLDLPSEIIDLIVNTLYTQDAYRLSVILPISRVCRQFRRSALPFLFESTSCVIREDLADVAHRSFHHLKTATHLLPCVKQLWVRAPLKEPIPDPEERVGKYEEIERRRLSDIDDLAETLKYMRCLQTLRLRCSVRSATAILQCLPRALQLHVVLDYIWSFATGAAQKAEISRLKDLLKDRTYSMGYIHVVPDVTTQSSDTDEECLRTISTQNMNALHVTVDQPPRTLSDIKTEIEGLNSPPFPEAIARLKEARLTVHAKHSASQILWSDVRDSLPWEKLLRLSMKGQQVQIRFESIVSRLRSLRALQLRAMNYGTGFHQNCAYQRGASVYSDVNYPYLDIEFKHLPQLRSLSVEGHCNHLPIQNLVSPTLTHLKLHRPHIAVSTASPESQRTATDIALAAKLAPHITHLELDINLIENLWHPTAIPGVDVDVELYPFLTSLSRFRHLRFLRLYPPFATRSGLALALSTRGHVLAEPAQPCSDAQAIKLFSHLRAQNPKLEMLCIDPSSHGRGLWRDTAQAFGGGFQTMRWEVRKWAEDKTVMVTRQKGRGYELRQVWEGERKIRTETKKDAYYKSFGDDPEGDEWILRSP